MEFLRQAKDVKEVMIREDIWAPRRWSTQETHYFPHTYSLLLTVMLSTCMLYSKVPDDLMTRAVLICVTTVSVP